MLLRFDTVVGAEVRVGIHSDQDFARLDPASGSVVVSQRNEPAIGIKQCDLTRRCSGVAEVARRNFTARPDGSNLERIENEPR